jgi:hypothetical protein
MHGVVASRLDKAVGLCSSPGRVPQRLLTRQPLPSPRAKRWISMIAKGCSAPLRMMPVASYPEIYGSIELSSGRRRRRFS